MQYQINDKLNCSDFLHVKYFSRTTSYVSLMKIGGWHLSDVPCYLVMPRSVSRGILYTIFSPESPSPIEWHQISVSRVGIVRGGVHPFLDAPWSVRSGLEAAGMITLLSSIGQAQRLR